MKAAIAAAGVSIRGIGIGITINAIPGIGIAIAANGIPSMGIVIAIIVASGTATMAGTAPAFLRTGYGGPFPYGYGHR